MDEVEPTLDNPGQLQTPNSRLKTQDFKLQARVAVLVGAGLAFMAGQGFARFGLTLILPEMQAALGMSYGDLGLIAGVAFGAYLLSAAPAGALAARRGPRPVVATSLALCGLGLALTGLAPSFPAAVAAQALTGAAGAGVIVPVLGLSPGWFERRSWARATGAIAAGGGVGLTASGLVVPALLRAGGASGWRLAWLSLGAAVAVIAGLALALLRNPPRADGTPRPPPPLSAVYRSAALWRVALAFACYGVAFAIYGTFFGAHLVGQRGLANEAAGQLWALGGLASIPSGLLGGWLGDRFGRRRPLMLLFLAEGISLGTLALGDHTGWYLASVVLYGLTVWGFPAVITAASADVIGPELAPAAAGLLVVVFGIGQAFGPPVAGALAQASGTLSTALLLGAAADGVGVGVASTLGSGARS